MLHTHVHVSNYVSTMKLNVTKYFDEICVGRFFKGVAVVKMYLCTRLYQNTKLLRNF